MFYLTKPKLRERLIDIMTESEPLTAAELQLCLADNTEERYTKQAVYKELRWLLAAGVLMKMGDRYGLKLTWIIALKQQVQSVLEYQLEHSTFRNLIPEDGEAKHWRFIDLERADDFWEQCLFALLHHTDEQEFFSWMPHPWSFIANDAKQVLYDGAMKSCDYKVYRIIGGDTVLDREFVKHWDESARAVSWAESPFHDQRKHYIDIVGDYVITIKLDEATSQRIDAVFHEISSLDEYTARAHEIQESLKPKIRFTVQHNIRKARKLRRTFCDYWSLPYRRRSTSV